MPCLNLTLSACITREAIQVARLPFQGIKTFLGNQKTQATFLDNQAYLAKVT
jgi:hypothetical protein